MRALFCRFRSGGTRLLADQDGSVMVLSALMLTVIVGGALIAIDLSRYANLQTQMQKAADSFALAGAAELDGGLNARARALRAINNLYQSTAKNTGSYANSAAFSPLTSGTTGCTDCVIFYKALPASDNSAMSSGTLATSDANSSLIEVILAPKTMTAAFAARLFGAGSEDLSTTATAVAGFTRAYCRTTPLFICNGPAGSATDISTSGGAPKGIEIEAKQAPGNGVPAPGNFGYIAIGSNGANVLANYIGSINKPNYCFSASIDTKTGNVASAMQAYDSRFDIYKGSVKDNDPDYAPDQNVRKGYLDKQAGPNCDMVNQTKAGNPVPPSAASHLPYGSFPSGDIGTAATTAELQAYWSNNYGETLPTVLQGKTRYDVYLYEIANPSYLTKKSPGDGIYEGETGAPCQSKVAASTDPERRVLYAAVIDCSTLSGGTNTNVNVLGLAKMFATRPSAGTASIFLEYQGTATPNSSNQVLKDIVRLYR